MPPKILVVDDSQTMRRINISALKKIGITDIDQAENGADALKKAEVNAYNLILLDINMPIMDGHECLAELKSNEKTKDAAVIMVTSESRKEDIMKAVKAGAIDYLTKPFQLDSLEEKIRLHIQI